MSQCICGNELEETKRGKRTWCTLCSKLRFLESRKQIYKRRDQRKRDT